MLRQRCRSYPALLNSTVVQWFDRWPKEGLRCVADSFLQDFDLMGHKVDAIVDHMVYVHQSVMDKSEEYLQQLKR